MKLIENWLYYVWHLWSIRANMVMALITGYIVSAPDEVKAAIPDGWRPLASVGIGLFVFAMATGSRLVVQPKLPTGGGGA